MSNAIRKRTQAEIVEYIKNHSQKGKLTESLMDIANNLGYSNATIHRVLRSLEEQGTIQIIQAEKPTMPNTIVYKGPIVEVQDVVSKGRMLLERVENLSTDVANYIAEANRIITKLKEESNFKPADDFNTRVIDRIDLPDGEHMLVMVRKDKHSGEPAVKQDAAYAH